MILAQLGSWLRGVFKASFWYNEYKTMEKVGPRMRLLYTDIDRDLTGILAQEALSLAKNGKRVFYIAPNSLSFEKERQVLELLPQGASFDITVTRFGQMVRYFSLNLVDHQESIDDLGLFILFYRALSNLSDTDLKVYGRLRQNMDFIQQLLDLYKELQGAGLSIFDLTDLDTSEKLADLQLIFQTFYALLREGNYQSQTKISLLIDQLKAGYLASELSDLALVIDGFTRFSIEEEKLIQTLHDLGVSILIGTYASSKAYKASYISGNLYEAGVVFLRELATQFDTSPIYMSLPQTSPKLGLEKISQQFLAHYDFSVFEEELTGEDKELVEIWEVISQKEEVIHVAKNIRQALQKGYRYKDITVLLGDVSSYRLHIGKIFDQYEIPYYLAKAEAMNQHPLVHWIDSLWRIKRYRFQGEDVMNFLKTGLYGKISQLDLDRLDSYIAYAQIKGANQFSKPFTQNNKNKFNLEVLNQLREDWLVPLIAFLQGKPRTAKTFLKDFTEFIQSSQLQEQLGLLASQAGQQALEESQQVWQVFCRNLEQFHRVFGTEVLSQDEALGLIRAGLMGSEFRAVPARVDVVTVKSYDLITPRSNKLVFAIGLTQGNFPKVSQNQSLISDEERFKINDRMGNRVLEVPSQDQGRRNHFTALSLLNSAQEKLVLSYPQLFNETDEEASSYLKTLFDLGLEKEQKGRASFDINLADVGNYKGLLSQVVELNRQDIGELLDGEEKTFWAVAVRYLSKKLADQGLELPQISWQLTSQPLARETLDKLYPKDQALKLSASALTDFYNSQYKYFLRHVLGLEELGTVLPDARIHGNFLHKVFETVLEDKSGSSLDQQLARAWVLASKDPVFAQAYDQTAETQFSQLILQDIAQATASVLRDDQLVETLAEEASFEETLTLPGQRRALLVGKIDRIDQLKTSSALGVVDYKSSAQTFKFSRFYNGLSPQLMTYLLAMRQQPSVFGAMYLHMTDPVVALSKLKSLEDLPKASQSELQFKGLFVEETSQGLTSQYGKTPSTTFTEAELALLMAYTESLYLKAGQQILQGHFAINPYSEDGRTVAGDQYNSITHFEADLHLSQARLLTKLGRKKEEWLEKIKGDDHGI